MNPFDNENEISRITSSKYKSTNYRKQPVDFDSPNDNGHNDPHLVKNSSPLLQNHPSSRYSQNESKTSNNIQPPIQARYQNKSVKTDNNQNGSKRSNLLPTLFREDVIQLERFKRLEGNDDSNSIAINVSDAVDSDTNANRFPSLPYEGQSINHEKQNRIGNHLKRIHQTKLENFSTSEMRLFFYLPIVLGALMTVALRQFRYIQVSQLVVFDSNPSGLWHNTSVVLPSPPLDRHYQIHLEIPHQAVCNGTVSPMDFQIILSNHPHYEAIIDPIGYIHAFYAPIPTNATQSDPIPLLCANASSSSSIIYRIPLHLLTIPPPFFFNASLHPLPHPLPHLTLNISIRSLPALVSSDPSLPLPASLHFSGISHRFVTIEFTLILLLLVCSWTMVIFFLYIFCISIIPPPHRPPPSHLTQTQQTIWTIHRIILPEHWITFSLLCFHSIWLSLWPLLLTPDADLSPLVSVIQKVSFYGVLFCLWLLVDGIQYHSKDMRTSSPVPRSVKKKTQPPVSDPRPWSGSPSKDWHHAASTTTPAVDGRTHSLVREMTDSFWRKSMLTSAINAPNYGTTFSSEETAGEVVEGVEITKHHCMSRDFMDFFVPKFACLLLSWSTVLVSKSLGPAIPSSSDTTLPLLSILFNLWTFLLNLGWMVVICQSLQHSEERLKTENYLLTRFRRIVVRFLLWQLLFGVFLIGMVQALDPLQGVIDGQSPYHFSSLSQWLQYHLSWFMYSHPTCPDGRTESPDSVLHVMYCVLASSEWRTPSRHPSIERMVFTTLVAVFLFYGLLPPRVTPQDTLSSRHSYIPLERHLETRPSTATQTKRRSVKGLQQNAALCGHLTNCLVRKKYKDFLKGYVVFYRRSQSIQSIGSFAWSHRTPFCLEVACNLLELSYQTYFPLPPLPPVHSLLSRPNPAVGLQTGLPTGPTMDIDRLGLHLIATFHSPTWSTHGLIASSDPSHRFPGCPPPPSSSSSSICHPPPSPPQQHHHRLYVSFRGSTLSNLPTDFNIHQIALPDLHQSVEYFHDILRNHHPIHNPSHPIQPSMPEEEEELTPLLQVREEGEGEGEETMHHSHHPSSSKMDSEAGTTSQDSFERLLALYGIHDTPLPSEQRTLPLAMGTARETSGGEGKGKGRSEGETGLEREGKRSGCVGCISEAMVGVWRGCQIVGNSIPLFNQSFPRVHRGFWNLYASIREDYLTAIVVAIHHHRMQQQQSGEGGRKEGRGGGILKRHGVPPSLNPFQEEDETVSSGNTTTRFRKELAVPMDQEGAATSLSVSTELEIRFCGHSLGGVLATLAALDLSMNLPHIVEAMATVDILHDPTSHHGSCQIEGSSLSTSSSIQEMTGTADRSGQDLDLKGLPHSSEVETTPRPAARLTSLSERSRHQVVTFQRLQGWSLPNLVLYTFGTPKLGNAAMSLFTNRHLPTNYRVYVNDDLVAMLPKVPIPGFYRHCGSEVFVDNLSSGNLDPSVAPLPGSGHLLVEPSALDRYFLKNSFGRVDHHSLEKYRQCLEACFDASELDEYIRRDNSKFH